MRIVGSCPLVGLGRVAGRSTITPLSLTTVARAVGPG